jgi:hypothetical protein
VTSWATRSKTSSSFTSSGLRASDDRSNSNRRVRIARSKHRDTSEAGGQPCRATVGPVRILPPTTVDDPAPSDSQGPPAAPHHTTQWRHGYDGDRPRSAPAPCTSRPYGEEPGAAWPGSRLRPSSAMPRSRRDETTDDQPPGARGERGRRLKLMAGLEAATAARSNHTQMASTAVVGPPDPGSGAGWRHMVVRVQLELVRRVRAIPACWSTAAGTPTSRRAV